MPSRLRRSLVLVLLAGCGGETAIDLTLIPNPNLNDPSVLLEQLRTLELVVSSPEGLYRSTPSVSSSGFKLEDVDGDGQLDLVADREIKGFAHVPRIRFERGGIQAEAVDFRLEGGASCQASEPECQAGSRFFAAGGVQGVRFIEGQVQETQVPFNLRLLYRQPQVTQVNPADGASDLPPRSFGSVGIVFSKGMNPESVRTKGVVRVIKTDGSKEIDVPPSLITVTNLGSGLESPAYAEYRFQSGLDEGNYRVLVSSDALDISGRPLDQIPTEPGDQPFTSTFTISSRTASGPQCNPCPSWCSHGGTDCAPGLVCDAPTRTCKPHECPTTCSSGNVCQSTLGICVADCRVHGSYGGCSAGHACLDSGLCEP